MSIIYILLPLAILLGATFLIFYIWAVRSGQFEDTETPALKILIEDKNERKIHGK